MREIEGRIAVRQPVAGRAWGREPRAPQLAGRGVATLATCDRVGRVVVGDEGRTPHEVAPARYRHHDVSFGRCLRRTAGARVPRFRRRFNTRPITSTCLFNNRRGSVVAAAFVNRRSRPSGDATLRRLFGVASTCATRAFLPLLLASTEGHVVNTSSVNGLLGRRSVRTVRAQLAIHRVPPRSFAVKGFTEALITDFRLNAAATWRASVVMPGHIGTSIVLNSGRYFRSAKPEGTLTEGPGCADP